MKLLFKQRFFSWLDSYDIYDEYGSAMFTVEGKLSFGHELHILDSMGRHIGTVKEVVLAFLPRFEIYEGEKFLGYVAKKFSLFKPEFEMEFKGWRVSGNFFEWDYDITDSLGNTAAVISKQLFNFTDTYVLDIKNYSDALYVLMVVLAIDAERCSRR